ncbi:Gfo/Idh/MocA family protein [Bacillus solimangrovi]|uniref:Oxidoreductase n=1 Tax=Bacillus solimangrovi TaxID=1305675 RepID=A0A1E5LEF9_9BACI|nr:Gfo/Idh/MocA family oxidoreductase [Bacillus solimangrovi]OEH92463.1 oxidoreductase [Bacillus solimangrovi]
MIRFGTVGTNWITDIFLDAAKHHPQFSLKGVYSRSEDKAKEFAQKHDADLIFTDLEEMASSEDIDAVYIATPNSLHAQHAITFMNKGKHVLCEKPFASNLAEVDEMIEVAKKNNVLLMEALKTTFMPSFKAIRENIHKIGTVRRYNAIYCSYSSRYDAYRNGEILNAFNPNFSNGSLMDLGIYGLYPMVSLFGQPENLKANAYMLESGVDGEGSLLFKYKEMEAVVTHSKIVNSYVDSEIQGEDGTIMFDSVNAPTKAEIRYRDGSVEVIEFTQDKPPMYYELEEFIQLLEEGKMESSVNSHEVSRITASIMQEAREQIGLVYPADKR